MYTTSMGVIDLCDDGVDSYDGDVNVGVEFGLLDVAVVQTAAANRSRSGAGGAGTDADIQVPKRVHSWPLDVVVQTAGSDTQPPPSEHVVDRESCRRRCLDSGKLHVPFSSRHQLKSTLR